MAEVGGPNALDSFRADVRGWVAANFLPELRDCSVPDGSVPLTAAQEAWRKAVGERGWGTPTWPKQYGGGGLSLGEARVVQSELARAGAYNPIGGMGVVMFGPTLLEFGTEAQKMEHIPPICRGDLQWCQGFSEPGAGSDLAALSTKAEDKGDHFLINGSKIWTSGAQYADWIFCLVRTDTSKKHEGISFLLFSMRQPGVEVRPIKLINGLSPFCETFFTDARAEKKDLVGPLNGGWTIAKCLLQHERSGISSMDGGAAGPSLTDLAKTYVGVDDQGRIADADLRARVIKNEMAARAFRLTAARVMAEAKGNADPSAATSIMKNAGTSLAQERHELILEIMGYRGLGWEGEAFEKVELERVRAWLYGKAYTIYGGSHEVQSNIVSKRILGLPDVNRSS